MEVGLAEVLGVRRAEGGEMMKEALQYCNA